ncbi:cytosolic protein [Bacillus sp. FJAT-27245]|uniref:cytosolic protein n=1 Tax=Bacillus sp. FJAT-27245 TaxID=1684144 RepID=UPI000AF7FD69|nr:cytosolic protein [Bacillus sp. FJAT-27245]
MLKNLVRRFSNVCETSEGNPDGGLRTHYYRAGKDSLFTSLEGILGKRPGCRIVEASKERGEIACELSEPLPCFLIATIVNVRPLETAVDFHLSTERPAILGNYGKLRGIALDLYRTLDKAHAYIGSGKNSD